MSIRSREFTTLLIVKREEFISLIQNYPDDYERFCAIKDGLNLYNSYQLLNVQCLSCGKLGHLIKQCPYIHFIPKELKLRQQFMFCPKQERKNMNRINKYKSNSLLNHADVKGKAQLLQNDYEVEDSYSSSSFDYQNEKNNDPRSLFNLSKRFITYEHSEVPIESKTIMSPLARQQYNTQMSMDKNTIKAVSFNQIDDARESLIIDEQQLKFPSLINQSTQVHQREGEFYKNDFYPVNKDENDYEEYFKEYEEEIKSKLFNNISKGILLNKEYNRKSSNLTSKKSSKLSNIIEGNQQSLTSLQNHKLSPHKIFKKSDYNKLNSLFNQIIQVFIPDNSNIQKFNSVVEQNNNNQDLISQTSMNKSSSKSRRLALFQDIQTEQKNIFQKLNCDNSDKDKNDDIGTQVAFYKSSNSRFINEEQYLFLDGFDLVKSYIFYYPFNNIENQLELMCLSKEKKRQKMIRSHIDNLTGIRNKSFVYSLKKSHKSSNSIKSPLNKASSNLQDNILNDGSFFEEKDRKKSKFLKNSIHGQSSYIHSESQNQFMKKSSTTNKVSMKGNIEKQQSKNRNSEKLQQQQVSIENFNEALQLSPEEKQLNNDNLDNQKEQTENQFENLYLSEKMSMQKENNNFQYAFLKSKKHSQTLPRLEQYSQQNQLLERTSNSISELNKNQISFQQDEDKLDVKNEILTKKLQNQNYNQLSQNQDYSYQSEFDSEVIINFDSPNNVIDQNNIFKNTLQIIPKKDRKFQEN